MNRDPRLSTLGNQRVEQLAQEQKRPDGDGDSFTTLVLLVSLLFVATPPGWAAIIAFATNRSYISALEWMMKTMVLTVAKVTAEYWGVIALFVVGWIAAVWAMGKMEENRL